MLARIAVVTYQCLSCQSSEKISYEVVPRTISRVGQLFSPLKRCPYCGYSSKISSVGCKVMPNVYGHIQYGYWRCRNIKHDRRYHPLALRAAVEKRKYQSWPSEMWSPYQKVAEKGYPWRCPHCEEVMRYRDEREIKDTWQKRVDYMVG